MWVHVGIHIGVHIGTHIGVHIGTHIGCHMKNVINSTQSSSRSSPANCLKSPVTATNLTWDRSQGSTEYVFDHISLREVRLRLNTQSVVVFLLFSFTQITCDLTGRLHMIHTVPRSGGTRLLLLRRKRTTTTTSVGEGEDHEEGEGD